MRDVDPRELFNMDLVNQCAAWIREGEEVCAVGDVNENVVRGNLTQLLSRKGTEMEEFGQDYCVGDVDSHVYGNGRIAGGWKTRNLEVTQLLMLPFIESVGDHRSWIIEFTTRSLLGPNLMKIQRSIARRLVMANKKSVARYNELVKKLFEEHNIIPRMKWLLGKADFYDYPGPQWLEDKIKRIHVEMDQLRMRAHDKCRKILTPDAPCCPDIGHWDTMIHMYLALESF